MRVLGVIPPGLCPVIDVAKDFSDNSDGEGDTTTAKKKASERQGVYQALRKTRDVGRKRKSTK